MSDTIELIPIPEESDSPSEELDTLRGALEQAQRRIAVLEEGKEARATTEGERAIQELEFIIASARTVQKQVRSILTEREERRSRLLNKL